MTYSLEERVELIFLYARCTNYQETANAFANAFPNSPKPSSSTVMRLIKKFRNTGSVNNAPKSGRPNLATGDDKTTDVLARVHAEPIGNSTRRISDEAGISKTSVLRILKKNKFHPYKMQILHALHPGDEARRFDFCNWIENWILVDPDLPNNIMFSDEALFFLNGTTNRQNYRYWSQENPNWMRGTMELNAPRVMVWCGIWGDEIIGPFFFENTVTGQSYLNLLENDLDPVLDDAILGRRRTMWFQQDGAPPHFSLVVREWLDNKFRNRWIGRRGTVEWPARSPDLTPLDFYLWGYVKSVVYQIQPLSIDDLKQKIIAACRAITPDVLANVRKEFMSRIELCIAVNGQHFEHLI
jgi:transposase